MITTLSIGSEEELTGTPLACLKASPLHSSSCTCIRSNCKLQFLTFSSFKSQRQLGCDGDGFLESSCSCVQCTSPARCPWTLAFSTTACKVERQTPHHYPASLEQGLINPHEQTPVQTGRSSLGSLLCLLSFTTSHLCL